MFLYKNLFFFNIFYSFNPNHAYWNQRRLFSGNPPGMFLESDKLHPIRTLYLFLIPPVFCFNADVYQVLQRRLFVNLLAVFKSAFSFSNFKHGYALPSLDLPLHPQAAHSLIASQLL